MSSNKEQRLYEALRTLMKENEKLKNKLQSYHEPIAIVGMACRLPSASSVLEFWELLANGQEAASEVPSSRWDNRKYYDPQRPRPGKIYTNQANFIEDYEAFDAEFFSITPKEVECIDPQHRLIIELTHLAFENALIPTIPLRGTSTGVFIGHFTHDYANLITKYAKDAELSAYVSLGNSASTIAGRISYIYGLRGPSFPINTACSSSLVAAHLACESLRRGECNLAIVGGVNLMLSPEIMINICQAQMLSNDGRCHTFAKDANGYGRGEGAGVVILKRLKDAIADEDNIAAVILASGTNQDGASSALSVPNGQAQKDLLTQVLKSSELKPEDIDYLEAHGTGTALGDPIEINAINEVYKGSHRAGHPMYVSSVKANIGHLEAAAGVAGLIKLALCLQKKVIPPHVNLKTLNPAIDLDAVPLVIPSSLTKFAVNKVATAAISAFGFSGSNAHMILKEPPKNYKKPKGAFRAVYLTKLSAKSQSSLKKLMENLLVFLTENPEVSLANLSYSLNVGRDDYDYRVLISAASIEEFYHKIDENIYRQHEKTTHKMSYKSVTDASSIHDVYLQGGKVNWPLYEKGFEQEKIQLINYPFQKKSYRLPYLKRMHEPEDAQSPEIASMYEKQYVPRIINTQPHLEPKLCLIVTGDRVIEEALKKVIHTGMKIHVLNYSVDNINSIKNTCNALFQNLRNPLLTLYCLPLNIRSSDAIKEDVLFIQTYQELISKNGVDHQFYYLTRNASLKCSHELQIEASATIGLLRAINFEYSVTDFKNIDFNEPFNLEDMAENMGQEINGIHHETEVVYQNKERFVPSIVPLTVGIKPANHLFKANKSYVITGGLGGLGVALGKHLYEQSAGNIHLLSRREPSDDVKRWIKECNSLGTRVLTHQVDVSDREKLITCLLQIEKKSFPIAGFFHLAGTDDRDAFTEYSWSRFAQVLRAKVLGAQYLHEYTKDKHLDYFVLFSSVSSTFGSSRQAPYVMANAYLDALALTRKNAGCCGQSIQWGAWAEEGLINQSKIRKETKEHLLLTPTALNTLDVILRNNFNQVTAILPGFLQFLLSFFQASQPDFLSHLVGEAPKARESDIAIQLKETHVNQYESIIEEYLLNGFRMMADYDDDQEIDMDKSFFEMGVDSLMAIEFAEYCQKGFGSLISLAPTLLFEVSSLKALRQHIATKIKSVLQEKIDETIVEDTYSTTNIQEMSLDEIDAIIRGEKGDV